MALNAGALVAGVDSSTQSTKVEIRSIGTGEVIAVGKSSHPPTTPPVSEQDPESWWRALVDAFAQIPAHVRNDVAAMSVAGQQHGLVLIDADGRSLRPAKLWNDTQSAPQASSLVDRLSPDGWARACGSVPGPAFTITKLAWVAENEPGLVDRVAHIMLPHDYLTWRLSGRHVTDRGDASGTGWWSPTTGEYRTDLLDLVTPNLLDRLPEVLGPAGRVGGLTADSLGLDGGVVVGPGTGDNMAGALGLGLRPGDLAVSVGTSGTVYAVSASPTEDPSGDVAGFADATGNFLPLVCTLNATKVTEAFRNLLGVDHTVFDALALAAEPGAGGVTLVPYLDGERTPNRPDATGTMTGLRSDVSRERFARAAFEGVACGLLDGVDALAAVGVALDGRFFLLGGGARSAGYRRTFADLSGRSLIVPDASEVVAAGACVQAAAVLTGDRFDEIADRWHLGAGVAVDPEPDAVAESGPIRSRYAAARGG